MAIANHAYRYHKIVRIVISLGSAETIAELVRYAVNFTLNCRLIVSGSLCGA